MLTEIVALLDERNLKSALLTRISEIVAEAGPR